MLLGPSVIRDTTETKQRIRQKVGAPDIVRRKKILLIVLIERLRYNMKRPQQMVLVCVNIV